MQHGTWISWSEWGRQLGWSDQLMRAPAWYCCIASWEEREERWPRDTGAWSPVTGGPAQSQVMPHPGQWTLREESWSSRPSLPWAECLRSQLRNKHVFCKEGQITWLTLLGVRLCISRCMLLGVTRSSQQTRHIIIPGRCINSAGFIAKPPLLSLFA